MKRILCLGFLLFNLSLFGQLEENTFYYGFHAGATATYITDIKNTIIQPIFPQETYTITDEYEYGFAGAMSVFFRFPESGLAIQPEIGYVRQGGRFDYSDINGLEYTIRFPYSYLCLSPILKYYPVGGFNIGVGPQLGLILDGSNLKYTSNMPELGPDLQIQQSLREVLKGNNNVSFLFGLGYDAPFGLSIDARFGFGISDVIETQANGFYFIENKNRNSYLQLRLGYFIPFFN
ncbi:MAG: PorT family protein [Saprospiraceae bacterium]|nr:PorT family protein [Saprospiraceae bacterium]